MYVLTVGHIDYYCRGIKHLGAWVLWELGGWQFKRPFPGFSPSAEHWTVVSVCVATMIDFKDSPVGSRLKMGLGTLQDVP